jgi:NTE family protein/lysophospholipid hydrolase
MGLLTGEPRSATVETARDSQLARLDATSFHRVIERYPQLMVRSLSRTVIERLQRNSTSMPHGAASITTVAVFGALGNEDLDRIAARISAAFGVLGRTALLTSCGVDHELGQTGIAQSTDEASPARARLLDWLSELELAMRYCVYQTDRELTSWTLRCLRQADHIVVVADSHSAPDPSRLEAALHGAGRGALLASCSLLLVHPEKTIAPIGVDRWMGAFTRITRHHHVRINNAADYQRTARLLSNCGVGLVLGGGGARGFAHVGVVRALRDVGVPVDAVGGTSVGALFAAFVALGLNPDEMLASGLRVASSLLDPTIPLVSIASGNSFAHSLRASLGERLIEDLWIPFYSVSANMTRAEIKVHNRGSLFLAVLASNTAPGVYPPLPIGDDLHLDGGILNNVPADVMCDLVGDGQVIAVDVSPPVDFGLRPAYGVGLSGWRVLWSKLNPFGTPLGAPGIVTTLLRVNELSSIAQRRQSLPALTDLYLRPPTDRFKIMDHRRGAEIAEAAYAAIFEDVERWWRTAKGRLSRRREQSRSSGSNRSVMAAERYYNPT